jgi:hypothetical protein
MSDIHSETENVNAKTGADSDFIEVTALTKPGAILSKLIHLDQNGRLVKDGSACVMTEGIAGRMKLGSLADFGAMLDMLPSNVAVALGRLRPDLPNRVTVTTKSKLATAQAGTVSRTSQFIHYEPGKPALMLLDYDTHKMPAAVEQRVQNAGNVYAAICEVMPALGHAGAVGGWSTSHGLYNADTGERFSDSGGAHVYVLVRDDTDIERFLETLHKRLWLAGYGWLDISKSGSFIQRSLIDRSVSAPERLCFEGAPHLVQDDRECRLQDGQPLDTWLACYDLTAAEAAEFNRLVGLEKERLKDKAASVRAKWISERARELVRGYGFTEAAARRAVEAQCEGVLLPWFVLPFDDESLTGRTVEDVLKDPDRFVGETLADPTEGVEYGRCKAKVLRWDDGSGAP